MTISLGMFRRDRNWRDLDFIRIDVIHLFNQGHYHTDHDVNGTLGFLLKFLPFGQFMTVKPTMIVRISASTVWRLPIYNEPIFDCCR
jgi:hypothetical protein